MKARTVVTLAWMVAALGAAAHLAAQEAAPDSARSLIGFSVALGPASEGLGAEASLSVGADFGEVILRTAGSSEFDIFSTPETEVSDVALLYGRRQEHGRGWLGVALGPGLVKVARRGTLEECAFLACRYAQDERRSVGLAFRAEAVFAPWRFVGLGVRTFGNVNPEQTFTGIGVMLTLGAVR